MKLHAPADYKCPFCRVVSGIEDEFVRTKQDDIVYQSQKVTAFISSGWWPHNPGHVLIIPNQHCESTSSLPLELDLEITKVKRIIIDALYNSYNCPGVSTRQHNGPDGGQDVWHYHLHVFPRYENDRLYKLDQRATTPEERLPYAQKLREYLQSQD